MEKVCLGLPEKKLRHLAESEKRFLENQASRWLWHCVWVVVGPLPLLLILPFAYGAFPLSLSNQFWFGQAWFVFFCMICIVWLLGCVFGFQYFHRYRTLQHALREGYVVVFEGIIQEYRMQEDAQYQLVQTGFLRIHPRAIQTVELLPESHVLYKCNGLSLQRWMTPHVAVVASPPASTFRVPLSSILSPGQSIAPELERRHLNADERTELEQHIKSFRKPFWGMLGLLSLLTAILLFQLWDLYNGVSLRSWHTLLLVLLCVICYYLGKRVFLVYKELRDIKRDLHMGWVICIPKEAPKRWTEAKVSLVAERSLASEEKERLVEILPVSTTLWSVCGKRADWRTQSIL